MNETYAINTEQHDYEKLQDFNKFLKLKELGKRPAKDTTDASGFTADEHEVNIELKSRNININTFQTIYIESHKIADMLLDYNIDHKIPLYINFLQDDYVVVFNLAMLKHRPEKIIKPIWSQLYQSFELGKREGLLLEDAWIYQKQNDEYVVIQRGRKK